MRKGFLDIAQRGLGVQGACSLEAYNNAVDKLYALPGPSSASVAIFGNTRRLWPHVCDFAQQHHRANPVDEYCEEVIRETFAAMRGVVAIRFSHELPPRRVAIQRLAEICNVSVTDPTTHHSIHPKYGPWISLRAAVVFELPLSQIPVASPLLSLDAISQMLPLDLGIDLRDPFAVNWVAVRDAIPFGQEHRFSEQQLEYHYTGKRPQDWL